MLIFTNISHSISITSYTLTVTKISQYSLKNANTIQTSKHEQISITTFSCLLLLENGTASHAEELRDISSITSLKSRKPNEKYYTIYFSYAQILHSRLGHVA